MNSKTSDFNNKIQLIYKDQKRFYVLKSSLLLITILSGLLIFFASLSFNYNKLYFYHILKISIVILFAYLSYKIAYPQIKKINDEKLISDQIDLHSSGLGEEVLNAISFIKHPIIQNNNARHVFLEKFFVDINHKLEQIK